MYTISWVIEYSVKENSFHITEIEDAIKRNLKLAIEGVSKDYVMIGGFQTRLEAEQFCMEIRTKMDNGIEPHIHVNNFLPEKKDIRPIFQLTTISEAKPERDFSFVKNGSAIVDEDMRTWWETLDFAWQYTFLHNLQYKNQLEKNTSEAWFSKLVYEDIDKVCVNDQLVEKICDLKVITLRRFDLTIESLEPVRRLKNLKALNCHACENLSDFTPLIHHQLEVLQLTSTGLQNIEQLINLTNLVELHISYFSGMDFNFLSNFKLLRKLSCYRSNLKDLSVLSGLNNLETIMISYTPVTDLTPLYKLKKLTKLDLYKSSVKLKEVEKLRSRLTNCKVRFDSYSYE